jgi:hypothetical protein
MKNKLVALSERTSYFEEKMRFFQENDLKNQELKEHFEEMCLANERLKEKLEENHTTTIKQESFVKEWQETVTSLNANLATLTVENKGKILKRKNSFKRKEIKIKWEILRWFWREYLYKC